MGKANVSSGLHDGIEGWTALCDVGIELVVEAQVPAATL